MTGKVDGTVPMEVTAVTTDPIITGTTVETMDQNLTDHMDTISMEATDRTVTTDGEVGVTITDHMDHMDMDTGIGSMEAILLAMDGKDGKKDGISEWDGGGQMAGFLD